jgi:hypothetical protein
MTQTQSEPQNSTPALPEIPNWLCLCAMAAMVLVLLGKALFITPDQVLSDGQLDIGLYFIHWRYFGFNELRAGHLALWNPHCFCGAPFFGNFQSALLYPLNVLYVLAPLAAAINWTIALHVFLGGVFTFYWARYRGLHSAACLLAGTMFMFCGPHFLQIQAGHLPNLCALIWAPLLFLAIEQLTDRPALAPCLLGMFAFTMAILAGHPQYVFYMGVAAVIYAGLNLLTRAGQRGKTAVGLIAVVAGGICLSAVQLFTGLAEGRESSRSAGLTYHYAQSFSFPPENFLTLLAPRCFGDAAHLVPGDNSHFDYFGRWFVTETSLFVSVAGLALAVCGMARGARETRRFSITMLIISVTLALGGYTPLFRVLYNFVPGFNLFRGMDKFLWLAALFLSLLAAIGTDALLRGRDSPRWLIAGSVVAGLALGGLSFLPRQTDWWSSLIKYFSRSTMVVPPEARRDASHFFALAGTQFSRSLLEGVACLFLAAGLLAILPRRRRFACGGLILMAVIELGIFANASLVTFTPGDPYLPGFTEILARHPGDYRIAYDNPYSAMTAGTLDIGGDDPSAMLRYYRYLDFTEGLDFDQIPLGAAAKFYDTMAWRILRCRYLVSAKRLAYMTLDGGLPRVSLVDRFRVMTDYHEVFTTLTNASFNVADEVILENPPDPAPQPASDKGTVRILDSSTDDVTIEADAKSPCLLFMTDSYSSGWRVLALPGSSQSAYHIMPADYCLRAIPLAAGHHLLRLQYSPLGYRIGKVVSIVTWPIFLALAGLVVAQRSQCKRKLKIDTGPRASL